MNLSHVFTCVYDQKNSVDIVSYWSNVLQSTRIKFYFSYKQNYRFWKPSSWVIIDWHTRDIIFAYLIRTLFIVVLYILALRIKFPGGWRISYLDLQILALVAGIMLGFQEFCCQKRSVTTKAFHSIRCRTVLSTNIVATGSADKNLCKHRTDNRQ